MTNSRAKGARGERELAAFLRERGVEARRGQQFSGGSDSPDVVAELPLHLEVKRTERLRIWEAIEQAKTDAGEKPWCVAHRANGRQWVAIIDMEHLIALLADQ